MAEDTGTSLVERSILRKVTIRLIPFLFILYVGNYLDRMNIGFAKDNFVKDLKFSDTVYGIGAGIFFIGYFLFEVPSNIILERIGARVWIARIMITWGIISAAMMFTNSIFLFYLLRFLLGVAEAGFFPGIILYLTYWFPREERARAISRFMTATPISGVIGAPLSSMIMNAMPIVARNYPPTFAALKGWQWLFLLEGIPSILLGVVVLLLLTDKPEKARWLTEEEKAVWQERLRRDREINARHGHFTLRDAFKHPQVILLCAIYFALQIGFYGFGSFFPSIMNGFKLPPSLAETLESIVSAVHCYPYLKPVSLLIMIPYFLAAVCMMLVGLNSDRTRERRLHVMVCSVVSAIGMACAGFADSPALAVISFSVTAVGLWGTLGPFWSLPTSFLSGTAAAGGIAFINSIGNLGGFVGPYTMGALKDRTQSYTIGLLALACSIFLAGMMALAVHREKAPEEEVVVESATAESVT